MEEVNQMSGVERVRRARQRPKVRKVVGSIAEMLSDLAVIIILGWLAGIGLMLGAATVLIWIM